ncbi:unnamed protein product [Lampetra fluviatilis]
MHGDDDSEGDWQVTRSEEDFALRRQRDRKRDSRPLPNAVSRRSAHARAACVSLTGDAFVAARGTNREDFSGGGGS